jgi:adenosine kinase
MSRQVSECREFGLKLVYDPGQQVSSPDTELQAGVEAAEILFVNDYELSLLCERLRTNPEKLKAAVPLVITTLGIEGSLIEGQRLKEPIKIGIAQPSRVADPTGAGDAYRAGFLYGYLQQWELGDCGKLGAVMASFVVEQHGTQVQTSIAAITERYQATFNQEINL